MEMPYIIKLPYKEPVSDVDSPQEIFSTTENHIQTSTPQDSFSECGKPLAKESSKDTFLVAEHHLNNTITSHSKLSSDKEPLCDAPLVCGKCKKEFTDKPSLMHHMDTHIPVRSKSVECKICHDKFPSRHSMKKHITEKHTIFFKCETCGRRFQDRDKLSSHRKNIHTTCDRTFVCDICEKSFLNERSLAEHVKLALHPESTKKSDKKDLDHLQMHNEKSDTPLFCKKCKKEFTDKPLLMHHMDTHIPIRSNSVECKICHDKFPSRHFMKKHITEKHTNFFQCETCGRRFQDSIRLSSHKQNVHSICGICDKRFLTNRELSEHINLHRNDQILMNESLK